MSEAITISPEEPVNEGMDYPKLREEGIKLVQQWAGKIWTDYNEHDPGVTTLEQLCYALTELSYRAEFPLEDLLVDRKSGRINVRQQALFIPRRILTCNPLTENDYRRLLVDRVPQLANVWLTPVPPSTLSPPVNGLYNMAAYAPGSDPCACDPEYLPETIRKRMLRVYCRHRDLCENVHAIYILKPVSTIVYADVNINEVQAAETILAQLFFQLANFLAPELRRTSLKSLLELGESSDEIFNGPLLRNGFISEDQLQPKAAEIPVQDIIRVITRTPGVISARDVLVHVGKNGTNYKVPDSIKVPETEILQLDVSPDVRRGNFSIRLFRNGVECKPDPMRVKRELDKLWTDYRRTYRLMPQYEEFFAVPEGRYRDVERYYSIQNQYPNVYGINSFGLPSDATEARRGQAKQLKGYLLVFEQLLADYFAQLAHVKELYSTEAGLQQTYFYQLLTGSVPDVEPLFMDRDYPAGLSRVIQSQDAHVERRNRFLDFLLALYAEQVKASSISELAACSSRTENSSEELIRVKLELLRSLIASTHNRGRGFDYLALPSARNIAGMEIKCRIQLGMSLFDGRPLIEALDEYGWELVESDEAGALGRSLSRHADYIEDNFEPVAPLIDERELAQDRSRLFVRTDPMLRTQPLTEEFLRAAEKIENYSVGSLPGDETVALVCKSPTDDDWLLVGRYNDRQSALTSAALISKQMSRLFQYSQQLYIVEHTLLWYEQKRPDGDIMISDPLDPQGSDKDATEQHAVASPPDDFDYSFTITAVVSALPRQLSNEDFQTMVREVVRENAPSHIVADFCFLRPVQMRRFETLYWDWRRALRHRQRREIIAASNSLKEFLQQCPTAS